MRGGESAAVSRGPDALSESDGLSESGAKSCTSSGPTPAEPAAALRLSSLAVVAKLRRARDADGQGVGGSQAWLSSLALKPGTQAWLSRTRTRRRRSINGPGKLCKRLMV